MAKKKRQHRKSRGVIGSLLLTPTQPHTNPFKQREFPITQREIEKSVVDQFVSEMKKYQMSIYDLIGDPVLNPKDPPDFFIDTIRGMENLELMEVRASKGRFEDAPGSYNHGEMVDWIFDNIKEKIEDYNKRGIVVHHMLIYPTGWQFTLSPEVLKLVSYKLESYAHGLKTITFFQPYYEIPEATKVGDNNRAAQISDVEFSVKNEEPVSQNKKDLLFIVQVTPHPQWDFDDFNEQKARATITIKGNLSKSK